MSNHQQTPANSAVRTDLPELIAKARAGDQESIGRVFEMLRPYLLQIANEELDPKLRQKAGGSDIVQQTLLEAGQAIHGFDGDSPDAFVAWIRRILLNNVANHRRHFQTEMRNIDREIRLSGEGSSAVKLDDVASAAGNSGNIRKQEELALVAKAIQFISNDYRQVIFFRNEEKRSFLEIGTLMNRTEEAARKLWARAIESLKFEIDKLDNRK
ncbi:MAG: sigma-70 family RNA polymerase sigma factor [Pirellulales bacterium]